jgi:hypothetical protein
LAKPAICRCKRCTLRKKGFSFPFYRSEEKVPTQFKPFVKKIEFETQIGTKTLFVVQCSHRGEIYLRGDPEKPMAADEWATFLEKNGVNDPDLLLADNELVYFT